MWFMRRKFESSLSYLSEFMVKLARSRIASVLPVFLLLGAGGLLAVADSSNSNQVMARFQEFSDPHGRFANLNLGGPTDTTTNPFFQHMGTNGRSCVTCHQPSDAFSVTPPHIRKRFDATRGTDPLFRPVDGANCPMADVSTMEERREAYSLLLTRGLIRIGIAVPENADYQVVTVYNPYGCNATDVISMYRRPLPTTNLRFLSAVMFDGRESSSATGTTKIIYSNYPDSLMADLAHQSVDATIIHAQGDGTRPTAEEQQQIVDFETKLFTAQTRDRHAGDLDEDGAKGGPTPLSTQPFFITINSSVHFLLPAFEQPGGLVTPGDGQFTPNIFNLYGNWAYINDRDYESTTITIRGPPPGVPSLAASRSSTPCKSPSPVWPASMMMWQPEGWSSAAFRRCRATAPLATTRRMSATIPSPHLWTSGPAIPARATLPSIWEASM